jgi:hypothetical protein
MTVSHVNNIARYYCHGESCNMLIYLVISYTPRNNIKFFYLNGFFFLRGKDSQYSTGPLPPDKHAKDVPFLDKYALERWEVYSFLVYSMSLLFSSFI